MSLELLHAQPFRKDQAYYVLRIVSEEDYFSFEHNPVLPEIITPQARAAFEKLKLIIKRSPAAHSPDSRLIIEDNEIYFGHSLKEIDVAFPGLRMALMSRPLKSFSEDNICSYGYNALPIRLLPLQPISDRQHTLVKDAKSYFENYQAKPQTSIVTNGANQSDTPAETLENILNHTNVLSIGEQHHHHAPKKILIDNMAMLKANGVDAIYLEHVFYDTQRELFEDYFRSEGLELTHILKKYLQYLDCGFELRNGSTHSPYSFTGLVIQAKRHGIRIIPIDTDASYSTGSALHLGRDGEKDPANRCLMMNYNAAQIFQKEQHSHRKAIFLVGSAHINQHNSGQPGISEITGAPTLVVEDSDKLHPEHKTKEAKSHIAAPDLLVQMETQPSTEAEKLQAIIEQQINSEEQQKTITSTRPVQPQPSANLEHTPEVQKLRQAIAALHQYGRQHKKSAPDKYQAAQTIADDLTEQLSKFISNTQTRSSSTTANEFEAFKSSFLQTLHSNDALFAQHRKYYRVILVNIAIALTGIGALLLAGKLAYTYATTGQACGFFAKTHGLRTIENIDSTCRAQLKTELIATNA